MASRVSTQPAASVEGTPTRVRYWVIVFAVTLAVITYIDRVCISWAKPFMQHDLGLTDVEMGWAFSLFGWAYAVFEVPGGFLGDWIGPRKVLMRIVLWWSFFTAATGWAWNATSLQATRFLFGAGEAGCFPNLTKAFTTWLPEEERVRAQGIMWLSARWGGAFTPWLVVPVIGFMGWRYSFGIFGCLGALWAIVFYFWYRDDPLKNPKLNAAERQLLRSSAKMAGGHPDVPWGLFLRSRQVWMLCWQYFCLSYGWYFYITWLPTYMREGRHMEVASSALLGVLPLFMGGLGNPAAVYLSSWMISVTHDVRKTRRVIACFGFAGASGFLVYSTTMHEPLFAMLMIGMASFCNDLVMPGSWAAAMDVGGKHAGTLSGAMNMWGNIGGAICPMVIGYILKFTDHNWNLTFYLSAAIYLLGIVCWLLLDPVTPLERAEPA
ncbi:MAG TPA: MFS transporter [Bryobacteraceae bacterium]|jgi:MFS family permease